MESDKKPGQEPRVKRKRRRRKRGSGAPCGNLNPVKAGAWAVLSEVRGLRAAPRERVVSMARTTAGFISDLGAESLLHLPTSKRLLLESIVGQVEMRRMWEAYILSRETREEFLAALERIVGSGHYLALCNSLRASLDKMGTWERVPREIEAEGNLEGLRRRFQAEGAASPPIAAPVDVVPSVSQAEELVRGKGPSQNSKASPGLLPLSPKVADKKQDEMAESGRASISREGEDGGSRDPSQKSGGESEEA